MKQDTPTIDLNEQIDLLENYGSAVIGPNMIAAILASLRELAEARGAEPVAWRVTLEDNEYFTDDENDAQLIDDATNSDAVVTPLYAAPKEPKI